MRLEGYRKLVIAGLSIAAVVALAISKIVTADQALETLKWIVGGYMAGNGLEWLGRSRG